MAKSKNNYIFPNVMANAMSRMTPKLQMESSMMSMFFMMIGLILTCIYSMFYLDIELWFKIVVVINGFFGIIFMFSYLASTFQSYKTYCDVQDMQKEQEINLLKTTLKGGNNQNAKTIRRS